MKHFFIIAGGKIEDAFAIEVLKGFAEKTVIAADSGMEFLRRNEIVPQVIIGDFDSVSKETLEWFQKKEGIVWHRLNPQKDDTRYRICAASCNFHGSGVHHCAWWYRFKVRSCAGEY